MPCFLPGVSTLPNFTRNLIGQRPSAPDEIPSYLHNKHICQVLDGVDALLNDIAQITGAEGNLAIPAVPRG